MPQQINPADVSSAYLSQNFANSAARRILNQMKIDLDKVFQAALSLASDQSNFDSAGVTVTLKYPSNVTTDASKIAWTAALNTIIVNVQTVISNVDTAQAVGDTPPTGQTVFQVNQ